MYIECWRNKLGKNILYVTNYYLEDVIAQRHSGPYISQAGQNKGQYMIDMFEYGGNNVTVWSNAWTNSHSLRFYKGFQSKVNPKVYYSDIVGAPLLNALVCYWSSKKFLRKLVKNKQIDAIVFYNMRLENSKLALYAKKKLDIPIILQYEDGLTTDAHISPIKRRIFGKMEKSVLQSLDGAFLVNSKLNVPCPSVVIRGAIREKKNHDKTYVRNEIPQLLFASTLDKQRGVSVLLEALKHIQDELILKISGRGDAESEIKKCADDRVQFLGYLTYEQYQEQLENADICINAQLAHHEFGNFSFPSKIFEYMSAGKVVVSSDVADAEDALGDTLIIYHEDNPLKLANALKEAIKVCKDEKLWMQYQTRMRRVIEENSIDNVAKRVNTLLDNIVKG